MSEPFGLPSLTGVVSLDSENPIKHPTTLFTEFAERHSQRHGLSDELVRDAPKKEERVRNFAGDAFRHAFMTGLNALASYRQKQVRRDRSPSRYRRPIKQSPDIAKRFFEEGSRSALNAGYINERVRFNDGRYHLMDLWNNGAGVAAAWEYLRLHDFDASKMTNDGFAAFVAGKIKDRPEAFILEPKSDPRTSGPSPRFDKRLLPKDRWAIWDEVAKA